jgi:hypothetical protein
LTVDHLEQILVNVFRMGVGGCVMELPGLDSADSRFRSRALSSCGAPACRS